MSWCAPPGTPKVNTLAWVFLRELAQEKLTLSVRRERITLHPSPETPLGSISLGALYEPVALTLEFRGTLYELAQKADLECPVVAQGAMHTSQ